jgi:PAS domain S-box-containing protein
MDKEKLRILYIEDSAPQAKLVKIHLEDAGYSVDIATDGAEGIAKFKSDKYDLIAVDHAMPIYQGLDVLRILSSQGSMPPTIMVTGSGNENTAVEALKLGASDYIIKDLDGHYIQLLPSVIDKAMLRNKLIRERQTMSVELLENEEKYRTMFEAIDDAICVWNIDTGIITDANSAAVTLYGTSRNELIGSPVSGLIADERERQHGNGSTQGSSGRYHKRKNGTIFPVEVKHNEVSLKGQRFSIDLILDVTERKRHELSLARKIEEQKALLSSIPAMVYFKNAELKYLVANTAFATFTETDLPDIAGKTDFDFFSEQVAENISEEDTKVISSGEPIYDAEQPIADEFGRTRWYQVTKIPYREKDGSVIGMVGMMSDITEQKNIVEHIKSRDAILEAAGYTAEKFLRSLSWEDTATIALSRIGKAMKVGRAYIYENHITSVGKLYMRHRFEWSDDDVLPVSSMPNAKKRVTYSDLGLSRWLDLLSKGSNVSSFVHHLPEIESRIFQSRRTLSVAIIPIFVGNYWWGYLGFEDCQSLREWSESELESLRMIANMLGAVIQRQRTQAALQRSEERLQLALDGADLGLWDWNISTSEVIHDKRWAAFLGYSQFDITKRLKTWEWLLHPDDLPFVKERINTHVEGQTQTYESEHRMLTKSGEWRWFLDRGKVVERDADGKAIRMTGTFLDITDKKLAEEQIRLQSNALKTAANSIIITDKEGTIVWVNPAFSKLTGYSYSEIVGNTMSILKSGEHDKEFFKDMWSTILNCEIWHGEIINKKKNGELYADETTISPVLNKNGQITHFVAIKQDITERKRAETELISAKQRAERHEKLKDAFIANISHEIRTPLNIILGHSSLINELYSDKASPGEFNCFDSIESAGKRLIQTVDSILIMSRLQAGDIDIQQSEIFLPSLIDSIVREMRAIAESKTLEIEFINNCGNVVVYGDEYFYTQAIKNLVDNAVKFTREGNVTLRLEARSTAGIFLDVEDTGIGISEEYIPHLFEPYSQEDSGYSRAYEGVGLGLALVQMYVQANGASIHVSSEKGKGSKFTIHFLAEHLKSDETDIKTEEQSPVPEPKKISSD